MPSPNTTWRETSNEVWACIRIRHADELVVFSTHTCMDGCEFHESRHIYTEYGFRDSNYPLMRATTRGHGDAAVTTFELCIPVPDDDEADQ